jgi:hypothetical protein
LDSRTAVANIERSSESESSPNFTASAKEFPRFMGKKNSGSPSISKSTRGRRGRGSGRGVSRASYKGRERDVNGRGGRIDGRPDSAIDEVNEEENSDGSSGGE